MKKRQIKVDTPKQRSIKAYVLVFSLFFVFVILAFWLGSPGHKANLAVVDQKNLVYRSKIHDQVKGQFKYDAQTQQPDFNGLLQQRKKKTGLTLRTELSIPKYKIDVPVFEGVTPYVLSWGLGTAYPNERLGSGNFAVEGHNYMQLSYAHDWFLSNLQKYVAPKGDIDLKYVRIRKGTPIYALSAHRVYQYRVISRQIKDVRNPTAAQVLKQQGNKPLLTMSTCYEQKGVLHPDQRIVVISELVKSKPFKLTDNSNSKLFKLSLN